MGESELPKAHPRLETEIGVAVVERRHRPLMWNRSWSRERKLQGNGLISCMWCARGKPTTRSVCS